MFVRNHSATREIKIGSNPTGPEPGGDVFDGFTRNFVDSFLQISNRSDNGVIQEKVKDISYEIN